MDGKLIVTLRKYQLYLLHKYRNHAVHLLRKMNCRDLVVIGFIITGLFNGVTMSAVT